MNTSANVAYSDDPWQGAPAGGPSPAEATELARTALIGRLIGGLTHEIGNPLTSITNALFLLKTELGKSQKGSRMLTVIDGEVQRIAKQIDYFRQFASQTPLPDSASSIGEMVAELAAVLAPRLRKREVVIACDPEAEPLPTPNFGRDFKLACLPLLVAGVDRAGVGEQITIGGRTEQDLELEIRGSSSLWTQAELECLARQEGEDPWLGITTGMRLTRELLAVHEGSVRWETGDATIIVLRAPLS